MKRLLKTFVVLLLAGVLGLGVFWQARHWARPARTPEVRQIAEGILYRRLVRDQPRSLVVHVVEVWLGTSGLTVLATPPDPYLGHTLRAATVSEFLAKHQLAVAINADGFAPWEPGGFLVRDYYPHRGDPVTATGVTVSDGKAYGDHLTRRPRLCVLADRLQITDGDVLSGTLQAVTGLSLLVQNGRGVVTERADKKLHPRTAIGLSEDGRRLWMVVVDGRQRGYSEGLTLKELASFMMELGASNAMNLDGGGSSTLAAATPAGVEVLNSPIHTGLPGRERPVANHLGIRLGGAPHH